MKQLVDQAQQFDPAVLTQDIVIIEELRRQVRQSQAGRALLDATLVRLALAEQFTPVAELLDHLNTGDTGDPSRVLSGASEKKKPEPPVAPPPGSAPQRGGSPTDTSTDLNDLLASIDAGDDLPRPGKVWEGPFAGQMRQSAPGGAAIVAPAPAPAPAADFAAEPEPANFAPVDITSLPTVWKALLERVKSTGPGLPSLLVHGELVSIDDGQATIRYGANHATLPRMLERNGKKEQLCDALSQVLNEPTGVRFEIADEPAAPSPPASTPAPAGPDSCPAPAPAPPAQGPIRITPELQEQLRENPLIRAALESFNGTIVKVE